MDVSEEFVVSMFKVRIVQGESTVHSPCHTPQKLHLHQHSCETLQSLTEVCGSYNGVASYCGAYVPQTAYTPKIAYSQNVS